MVNFHKICRTEQNLTRHVLQHADFAKSGRELRKIYRVNQMEVSDMWWIDRIGIRAMPWGKTHLGALSNFLKQPRFPRKLLTFRGLRGS